METPRNDDCGGYLLPFHLTACEKCRSGGHSAARGSAPNRAGKSVPNPLSNAPI